jgi:hypothetical protein
MVPWILYILHIHMLFWPISLPFLKFNYHGTIGPWYTCISACIHKTFEYDLGFRTSKFFNKYKVFIWYCFLIGCFSSTRTNSCSKVFWPYVRDLSRFKCQTSSSCYSTVATLVLFHPKTFKLFQKRVVHMYTKFDIYVFITAITIQSYWRQYTAKKVREKRKHAVQVICKYVQKWYPSYTGVHMYKIVYKLYTSSQTCIIIKWITDSYFSQFIQ